MVIKSKLKMALMAEKGVDIKKLKDKTKRKVAKKEKVRQLGDGLEKQEEEWEDSTEEDGGVRISDGEISDCCEGKSTSGGSSEEDEQEADASPGEIDFETLNESDSPSSSSSRAGSAEDPEDIPISELEDLSSSEKEDLIPHQRLTINNTTALTTSLRRIALPTSTLSFSAHQTITSAPGTDAPIPDISDDLTRELAFYAQSLNAAKEARRLLMKEGVPFSRPGDYFAEMVKADEHMEKVKRKLVDEAAGKKAASEARRQRDLKKFGKQVQVAKIQEREKEKKGVLEKIKVLKRKRQDTTNTATNEADLFDVALEEETKTSRKDRNAEPNKRRKKDEKFGFGGKKRFSKSGDAMSSGDLRGFSNRKMKGKGSATGGGAAKQRPGKARRAGGKR